MDALQKSLGPPADALLQLAHGEAFVADQGNVPGDGGEAGQRLIDRRAAHAFKEGAEVQLRGVELAVHAVVLRHGGVNLAQDAQEALSPIDPGTAARVIGGVGGFRLEAEALNPQALQHGLHGALHPEEVHAAAIGPQGQHLGLVSHAGAVVFGEVGPAQLIEPDGFAAVVAVPGQDFQHGGQGGGAHDGGILPQGV